MYECSNSETITDYRVHESMYGENKNVIIKYGGTYDNKLAIFSGKKHFISSIPFIIPNSSAISFHDAGFCCNNE